MAFGDTYEEVAARLKHPKKIETRYGWKVEAVNEPEFSLKQLFFKKGFKGNPNISGGVLYLEKGKMIFNSSENIEPVLIEAGKSLKIPRYLTYENEILEDTLAYLFSSEKDNDNNIDFKIKPTFGVLEKYWGKIENIYGDEIFTGKRIFMLAGKQSSLEYHCHKKEAYILQSGKLKVGLRVGRAENKSIILNPGDIFVLPQGTMHMRIGIEDCVILEVSTKDDDKDSHLVEDGNKYAHIEV